MGNKRQKQQRQTTGGSKGRKRQKTLSGSSSVSAAGSGTDSGYSSGHDGRGSVEGSESGSAYSYGAGKGGEASSSSASPSPSPSPSSSLPGEESGASGSEPEGEHEPKKGILKGVAGVDRPLAPQSVFDDALDGNEFAISKLNANLAAARKAARGGASSSDDEGDEGGEGEGEGGVGGMDMEDDWSDDEDIEPNAFGRAFSKVMATKLDAGGEAVPILAKNRALLTKINKELKEQREDATDAAQLALLLKKRGRDEHPVILTSFEREMIKFATMGVVQLFNAVSKHQQALNDELMGTMIATPKVDVKSKTSFLDLLKKTQQERSAAKAPSAPAPAAAPASKAAAFLDDGFATAGASRVKDWDQMDSSSDDGAAIEDSDSDDA